MYAYFLSDFLYDFYLLISIRQHICRVCIDSDYILHYEMQTEL